MKFSDATLGEQVRKAIDLRRAHTQMSANLIRQYAGDTYRSSWGVECKVYENFAFKWCASAVPQLAMFCPKVKVRDLGHLSDAQTDADELAVNALLPQINFAETIRAVALDIQFDFGVFLVNVEQAPGLKTGGMALRPTVRRVSPRMFFRDPLSAALGYCRFEGHSWVSSIDDIASQTNSDGTPKYDPEAVMKVRGMDFSTTMGDLIQDGVTYASDDKDAVVLHTVYLYEEREVVTLALNQDSAVILRRKPYQGSPKGPYKLTGTWIVPDQVYPLSALAVSATQVTELNEHIELASNDAKAGKRIVFANGGEKAAVAAISEVASNSIVTLPGFNGLITQVDVGGVRPETMEYINAKRQDLDTLTGLTDAVRGVVTGRGSATEAAMANQFIDIRINWAQSIFKEAIGEVVERIIGIMATNEAVSFPVARVGPDGTPMRGTYFGGMDEDDAWPWERSLTVEIEPYSMEYTNRAILREQMQAAQAHVLAVANAAAQNPAINAEAMIDDMLNQLNISGGSKKYLRFGMLQATQSMMMGQAMLATQGQAADVQAREAAAGGPPAMNGEVRNNLAYGPGVAV